MEKLLVPFFLISVVVLTAAIQPDTRFTAADLDMSDIRDINDKKKRFFDFMRPIINGENAKVLKLRKKLLLARGQDDSKDFVERVARAYSVTWDSQSQDWDKLLERVDSIALELSLAQSAAESAWGQSRFAREGNNFFGQWCYQKGCGIVPGERNRGAAYEVAQFDSINHSVRSYIKNINTGRVYIGLRKVRRENRAAGKQPDASAQAGGLIKYSQRREAYVKEIRSMIRVNQKLMLGL